MHCKYKGTKERIANLIKARKEDDIGHVTPEIKLLGTRASLLVIRAITTRSK